MNNKAELLEKYSSNLAGSKTRNHYLSYARDFLDHADGLDKEAVTKYIERLRKQKKRPGTVNFAFRVIRRLFMVNATELKKVGIEWPFLRGQAPQIGQRDEYKPILAPEIIKIMVESAKIGKLATDEAAFLALSSIYGLRRGEMVNLKAEDIDLASNTLFIATLKHGRERDHLVATPIRQYLEAHDFNQRYSLTGMDQLFWRIVNNSGLGYLKQYRLGWHALRRSLDRELIKTGIDPFAVKAFLRFKGTSGALAMPERYYSGVIIGLEGKQVVVVGEATEDKEVFEKYHPFLRYWKA